jgi:GABA(A) receptor-associated protein
MFSSRSSSTSTYKTKYSLEERIKQSEQILSKYVNYIPVIVECNPQIGAMKKQKFLVPHNVNCSHMIIAVRNQLKLDPSKSIFIFYNDNIICPTENVNVVYRRYLSQVNDGDRFFHIYVTTENTFGST